MTFPSHAVLSDELKDLLLRLLCKDPESRLGVENGLQDILSHPWFGKVSLKKISEKKIKPPFEIDCLRLNIEEQDFQEGEEDFKKLILSNLASE